MPEKKLALPWQSEIPFGSGEVTVDALIGPLNAVCREATGNELNTAGRCVCPENGTIFFVTYGARRGVCARPEVGATPEHISATSATEAQRAYSLAHFVGESEPGTFLNVYAPASTDQARAVGDWARDLLARGHEAVPMLWHAFQAYNEINVQVGRPEEIPSIGELLASTLQVQPLKNGEDTFYTYIVEPEVRALNAVLGIESLSPQERVALFQHDAPRGVDPRTVDDLLAAYDDIIGSDREVRLASGLPLFGADCTHDCIVFSDPLHVSPDAQVVIERLYSSGSLARESIWYRRHGDLRAVVMLGPNRVPGLIMLLEPQLTPRSAGGVIRLYDRQWNNLATYDVPMPDNFNQLWELQRKNRPLAADVPALVMCEGDMRGVMADPSFAANIAFGPHTPIFTGDALQHGSLFGWIKNGAGTMDDYLRGYVVRTSGFVTKAAWVDAAKAEHGRNVVLAAVESTPRLRILPIGSSISCFANYSQWRPAIGRRVSVVNASFAAWMRPQACRPQVLPVLRASADSTLWVVAAGNSENQEMIDTPKILCPGSLSGEKNLLTVSGATGDNIDPDSTRGATYADIAAALRVEGYQGTSFATPRVAAVAAELAQSFPDLTPEALRLTLMASSRITAGLRDSVRSGGLLDSQAAFVLGACVDDSLASNHAFSSGLLAMCMLDTGFEASFVDEKMAMLQERGAFVAPQ